MDISILGAFRSGTNFVRGLLEMNYVCTTHFDTYGWKHGFVPVITSNADLKYPSRANVVVTKNPFLQLYSLFNYARRTDYNITSSASLGLSEFLRRPLTVHDGKNHSQPEYFFPNAVAYYSSVNWNLRSAIANRPNGVNLRYEDLLDTPEASISRVADAFKLERKRSDGFNVPMNVMKKMGSRQHDAANFMEDIVFVRRAASPSVYMDSFTEGDIDFVCSLVPDRLLVDLGYSDLLLRLAPAGSVDRKCFTPGSQGLVEDPSDHRTKTQ